MCDMWHWLSHNKPTVYATNMQQFEKIQRSATCSILRFKPGRREYTVVQGGTSATKYAPSLSRSWGK
jgi:hypothetical protein